MSAGKEQHDRIKKMADHFAGQLGEHCTAVRIVCTFEVDGKNESGMTCAGYGNFYAQYGLISEAVLCIEEEMRERQRRSNG